MEVAMPFVCTIHIVGNMCLTRNFLELCDFNSGGILNPKKLTTTGVLNMNVKQLVASLVMSASLIAPATAGLVSSEMIFGDGNSNGGFTVETFGNLELGIRAKQRFPSPNDQVGAGIVQDADGTYLFDIAGLTSPDLPDNRAAWNFDWSIISDTSNTQAPDALSTYTYLISVDFDPSTAVDFVTYDPLSAVSTGYYLGDLSTANGAAGFNSGGDEDFSQFTVAQNSVNYGFLPGAPLRAGDFRVTLSAFQGQDLVGATSIDVRVVNAAVSAPATALLFVSAFGGLVLMRRQTRKGA